MVRLKSLMVGVILLMGVGSAACSSSSTTTSSGGGVTVTSGAGGTTVNIVVSDTKGLDAPQTLVPSVNSAKAGDITFQVKSTGTIEHEVVVLKTDVAFDQLKVGSPDADKVDESSSAGETDEHLKPGESRSFTIKSLAPGKYVFVCNIAKHYGLGMRAAFTVT